MKTPKRTLVWDVLDVSKGPRTEVTEVVMVVLRKSIEARLATTAVEEHFHIFSGLSYIPPLRATLHDALVRLSR